MTKKILVAYDGSASAKRAVQYAKDKAIKEGAELVIAHVLEWSPYSFLTPQEIEERHKRRKEELERAETALIKPLLAELSDVKVDIVIKYGNVADTIKAIVKDTSAQEVVMGRQGGANLAARVFGSTAGRIAQSVDVPCIIVP